MKDYYQFLAIITFALFTYACSSDTDDITNETRGKTADSGYSEVEEKYNFRETKWGMSRGEVKDSEEGEPVFESDKKIDYNTSMMGMESKIGYTFYNNELIRASFLLLTKPETNDEYIEKYMSIQKELTKINGKPIIDTKRQKDTSLAINPENNGDAICNGELIYVTQWDLPTTDIQLLLRGEDSECILTVLYISEMAFQEMIQNRDTQK